jgi:hypothetical protein
MLAGLTGWVLAAHAAVTPVEKGQALPGPWAGVAPQQRLAAIRVAELDATRLLLERIYGLTLSADTTVADFALQSEGDSIRGEIMRTIAGVATSEEPQYKEDGQLWVVRKVKLRQVIETITTSIKRKPVFGRMITTEALAKIEQENRDSVIEVMGNSAIPGSEGMRKIQAKRAAEMDAYRRLAERINGVTVVSQTTVKDFALESDEMRARITSQIVRGAKPVKVEYTPDGACEVTLEITLADIFKVIRVYSKKWPTGTETEITSEKQVETRMLTETGRGAPRPKVDPQAEAQRPATDTPQPANTFDVVSRTLVGRGVVID